MPSDVLARTCFVTTRDEDPNTGFQRVLDKRRAEDIATYIDSGFGTIPSSIVLSAQPDAVLQVVGRGKTLQFRDTNKAFLVLDGQHRVYGFSLAQTALRVPVVIYGGLSRQDETRLFIDINTKQRPVPNELLLDIKRLADYENDAEQVLRELFDLFNDDSGSPLLGLMSPAEKAANKISRVTFNAAVKPLAPTLGGTDTASIYSALNGYVTAFLQGLQSLSVGSSITNGTVFRASMMLFPDVAQRVKDRYGPAYTSSHFAEILEPVFATLRPSHFKKPGNSQKALYETLAKALRATFSLR